MRIAARRVRPLSIWTIAFVLACAAADPPPPGPEEPERALREDVYPRELAAGLIRVVRFAPGAGEVVDRGRHVAYEMDCELTLESLLPLVHTSRSEGRTAMPAGTVWEDTLRFLWYRNGDHWEFIRAGGRLDLVEDLRARKEAERARAATEDDRAARATALRARLWTRRFARKLLDALARSDDGLELEGLHAQSRVVDLDPDGTTRTDSPDDSPESPHVLRRQRVLPRVAVSLGRDSGLETKELVALAVRLRDEVGCAVDVDPRRHGIVASSRGDAVPGGDVEVGWEAESDDALRVAVCEAILTRAGSDVEPRTMADRLAEHPSAGMPKLIEIALEAVSREAAARNVRLDVSGVGELWRRAGAESALTGALALELLTRVARHAVEAGMEDLSLDARSAPSGAIPDDGAGFLREIPVRLRLAGRRSACEALLRQLDAETSAIPLVDLSVTRLRAYDAYRMDMTLLACAVRRGVFLRPDLLERPFEECDRVAIGSADEPGAWRFPHDPSAPRPMSDVRAERARVAARGAAAVAEALERLDDPDALVRERAVETLGLVGNAATSALTRLRGLERDPDLRVRLAASAAVERIVASRPRAEAWAVALRSIVEGEPPDPNALPPLRPPSLELAESGSEELAARAIGRLEKTLRETPDDFAAHLVLGRLLMRSGADLRARESLRRATECAMSTSHEKAAAWSELTRALVIARTDAWEAAARIDRVRAMWERDDPALRALATLCCAELGAELATTVRRWTFDRRPAGWRIEDAAPLSIEFSPDEGARLVGSARIKPLVLTYHSSRQITSVRFEGVCPPHAPVTLSVAAGLGLHPSRMHNNLVSLAPLAGRVELEVWRKSKFVEDVAWPADGQFVAEIEISEKKVRVRLNGETLEESAGLRPADFARISFSGPEGAEPRGVRIRRVVIAERRR